MMVVCAILIPLPPLVARLTPLLNRHSGSMFVYDVPVSRRERFTSSEGEGSSLCFLSIETLESQCLGVTRSPSFRTEFVFLKTA